MAAITRTLEPGITYFSAAEIRIVLLPIGEIPDDVFQRYASLVMAHRQVDLSNVRSFYKESQKSPFKFFPWKTGNMHFRFLPEDSPAATTSPLAPLHSHRKVLGVIGLLSCEHTSDITRKYKEFEQRCRAFPEATTARCLAFNPAADAHTAAITSPQPEDARSCPDLIIFPPTTKNPPPGQEDDHLINHMEVVMHDFAACVLTSLEAWMLTASPAMVSLTTLTDTSEFTGVSIPSYSAEDDAGRTKRKYARLQKAMGDYSLLAGSPLDAVDHYNTAVELGRASLDYTIAAAAMEGYAAAKLLHAAVSNDAFVMNVASVFRDESAWRSPRNSISSSSNNNPTDVSAISGSVSGEKVEETEKLVPSTVSSSSVAEEVDIKIATRVTTTPKEMNLEENGGGGGTTTEIEVEEELKTVATLAPSISTTTTRTTPNNSINKNGDSTDNKALTAAVTSTLCPGDSSSTAEVFNGNQFWDALRRSTGLEEEVRSLVEEAKSFIRKRGGLPLLVEADIRWARLLAGLHGYNARSEATELANAVQLAAEMLPLPEDRLIALTESASILGSVGAVRKRVLLMWQAVELSKYFGFPDARTLAVARSALEPATQHNQEHPLLHTSHSGNSNRENNNTNSNSSGELSSSLSLLSSSRYSGVINDDWDLSRPRPLDQETTIPASWGPVRAGCLEATLGLAIYAKRHADVFDAAAALLRDHSKELSAHRMQSLLDNLVAAASQMASNEKVRPGKGPPPLLHVIAPRAVPAALAPVWVSTEENHTTNDNVAAQSPSSRQNIFLYDPFSAKRQKERNELMKKKSMAGSVIRRGGGGVDGDGSGGSGYSSIVLENDTGVQWVSGEPAVMDIEVANPSSVSIKIEKLVLEAKFIPLPSTSTSTTTSTSSGNTTDPSTTVLPITATKAIWKGKPVSLNIPAHTKPVRIQLEGTPLVPGILVLTGCRLTAFGGVSWSQPWTGKPLNLAQKLAEASNKKGRKEVAAVNSTVVAAAGKKDASTTEHAADAVAVPMVSIKGLAVTILPALPRLKLELHSSSSAASTTAGEGKTSSTTPISLLKLVHGQSTSSYLVITNTGAVSIDILRIDIGNNNNDATTSNNTNTRGGGGGKSNTSLSKPISVDVDTSTLKSLLPLQPGQSISIPVSCRAVATPRFKYPRDIPSAAAAAAAAGSATEQQQQQQICTESISVEYASSPEVPKPNNSTDSTICAPSGSNTINKEVPGRRTRMDVAVAVAPSLHISHIEFAQVYEQQEQEQQRRVLMIADVVNKGSTHVETWLDLSPSAGSTSTNRTNSTIGSTSKNSHVVVIAPGQRAAVSYLINQEDATPLVSVGNGGSGEGESGEMNTRGGVGGGRNNAVVLRYEERERQACATSLAERIRLYFIEHNSGGGGGDINNSIESEQPSPSSDFSIITTISGCLPLIHGEIYNGLTPSVLCMLRPCAITLRFTIAPLDSETTTTQQNSTSSTDPVPLVNFSNNINDGETSSPALFIHPAALKASLGQPLKVNVEVESNVDEATEVFCSFMCTQVPIGAAINNNSPGAGAGGVSPAAGALDASTITESNANLVSQGPIGLYSSLPAATTLPGSSLGLSALTSSAMAMAGSTAATWTGIHSRLQISVPAKGKITHVAGVAVVAPGRYRIGTGHVTVTYPRDPLAAAAKEETQVDGASVASSVANKNTLVSAVPCFVAVE